MVLCLGQESGPLSAPPGSRHTTVLAELVAMLLPWSREHHPQNDPNRCDVCKRYFVHLDVERHPGSSLDRHAIECSLHRDCAFHGTCTVPGRCQRHRFPMQLPPPLWLQRHHVLHPQRRCGPRQQSGFMGLNRVWNLLCYSVRVSQTTKMHAVQCVLMIKCRVRISEK